MPEIVLRAAAKRLGLKYYFTGKPCKSGHVATRHVAGSCVECSKAAPKRREYRARWREANQDKCKSYNLRWQSANRDRMAQATLRHYHRNREEINQTRQKWRKENPGEAHIQDGRQRLARYGLDEAKLADMLASQNYRCAICETEEPGGLHGVFVIDHDHGPSGATRGLLCNSCNLGLGHARESTRILKSMVAYLELHARHETARGNAAKADTQAAQQPVPA